MDNRRCESILKIRQQARVQLGMEHEDKCPTCGKQASHPYRVKDNRGHVIRGCVDPHHYKWADKFFCSSDAKAIRAEMLKSLRSY